MRGFISQSACRGSRPTSLAGRRYRSRPDLIALLLKERHVVRFLVAPDSFGKTDLALEYAETMFEFKHVVWINGASPCFLRDLDLGGLFELVRGADPEAALVVIDDAPELSPERAELLSNCFDALLDRGVEVLVTCCPAADTLGHLQRDRLKLSASELLLSDAEIDASRSAEERSKRPSSAILPAQRVASLVWSADDEAPRTFLAGIARERRPLDCTLAILTALVMVRGSVSDLEGACAAGSEIVGRIVLEYPFTGIDVGAGRFSCVELPVERIAAAFRTQLDALGSHSPFGNRVGLVRYWANGLLAQGAASRACEVIALSGSDERICAWFAENDGTIVRTGDLVAGLELLERMRPRGPKARATIDACRAERLFALGDGEGAVRLAKRAAFDASAGKRERTVCLIILVMRASKTMAARACDVLESMVASEMGPGSPEGAARSGARRDRPLDPVECARRLVRLDGPQRSWLPLAIACCAWSRGVEAGAEACLLLARAHAPSEAVCLLARVLLDEAARRSGSVLCAGSGFERVCDLVRGMLIESEQPRSLYLTAAGLGLERARAKGLFRESEPLAADLMMELREAEIALHEQRKEYRAGLARRSIERAGKAATRPDAYLAVPVCDLDAGPSAPILRVRLFGKVEARIGTDDRDVLANVRHKAKVLFAMLVLNSGRELSRDFVVESLWPGSDIDTARKNFYTVWSQLKGALTLEDRTCPYLVRHQRSCGIDRRLLAADVARFNQLCRELLFGDFDLARWSEIYNQVEGEFGDDLMAAELENEVVGAARAECRARMVDALVVASGRLVASGAPQQGLWFARLALRRDRTREDAYLALIKAQISAGQRTSALTSYLCCRKVLSEELGIDPSLELEGLYRSLIDAASQRAAEER